MHLLENELKSAMDSEEGPKQGDKGIVMGLTKKAF